MIGLPKGEERFRDILCVCAKFRSVERHVLCLHIFGICECLRTDPVVAAENH